ncbi:MAG: methylmalonyl-CoA mutase family protein [Chitinophagales bacterium]|nr:methylmalonyl-CoA mutase family protein [Chitinophagales bacterium]MCZ2392256.1 methylmalonyl-CoA mutase family protein [Chitinophagales bacterium]
MPNQGLFARFGELTEEDWKNKIIQDLKGKDYDKTLIWTSPENVNIQPIYSQIERPTSGAYRHQTQWQIVAPVHVSKDANQLALENLIGGATQIHFIADSKTEVNIHELSKEIQLDYANISFENMQWNDDHKIFWQQNKTSKSHLGIHPLSKLHSGLSTEYDGDSLIDWAKFRNQIQAQWGILTIDGSIYKNAGGHYIDEIAFILAALQENLHHLQLNGISSDAIGAIQIKTAIGPNFFFEIAKIKTIRILAQTIINQYNGGEITILAESADIYRSHLDIETNILRLTTEAMSAILGGADAVMLHPYDSIEGNSFSHRISRNIQHLLIEESYFEKQLDPTSGSYYVEQLINDLKKPSWNVFLSIEKHQGYIASFLGKSIPEFFIFKHKQNLIQQVSNRNIVLLGANQFPNLKDDISKLKELNSETLNSKILQAFRLSEPFEKLRIRVQKYKNESGQLPKAFLWEHGQLNMRKARSTYAFNFLATAGIISISNQNPNSWDQTIEEIRLEQPEIVVFCSDNESWETFIPDALKMLSGKNIITIIAGKNDSYAVDLSIYEGCPLLDILQNILERLGIQ